MVIRFREKSQVTLPVFVVESFGLKPGDLLECEIAGGAIALFPLHKKVKLEKK